MQITMWFIQQQKIKLIKDQNKTMEKQEPIQNKPIEQKKVKRRRLSQQKLIQLSKVMSWILRHGAVKEQIQIDAGGYIKVEDLIIYLKKKGYNKPMGLDIIEEVIANNNKKRYEILERQEGLFIRATQGHSIRTVITANLLRKIENPEEFPTVIHGTFYKFLGFIRLEGLNRMKRNHIHLAPGLPGQDNIISGMNSTCQKAFAEGIQFYLSSNNVILTEGIKGAIPVQYFQKVTNIHGDQIL